MGDIYANIKKYRQAAKLSQAELAGRTGYTDRSAIAKIETGSVDISLSKFLQFSEALGVSPGQLLGVEQAPIMTAEAQVKNNEALELVARCGSDKEFAGLVSLLYQLDTGQARALRQFLLSLI